MTRKLLVAWDLQLSLGVLKDRDFSLVLMSSFTEKKRLLGSIYFKAEVQRDLGNSVE